VNPSPFDLSSLAETPGLQGLEYQPETTSTNDWALQLSSDEARRLPLLVLTACQTAGRGRGSNQWWGAEGALTFSLLINAEGIGLPMERWPCIALVTGLAVCEALQATFPEGVFNLKWPNDVYLGGRKLCGILVEVPSHTRGRFVIGVGINVNNSFTTAPFELREKATALCDAAGGEFDLSEVLSHVIARILRRIHDYADPTHRFIAEFRRYCLLTGRTVRIEQGSTLITGQCQGIAEDGTLLVQTETGLKQIVSGTVIME
jgi:BirA family transcriptional regulator, biotin operon repressor / biotin---[acetyl-CoA-carboxylase] ligase